MRLLFILVLLTQTALAEPWTYDLSYKSDTRMLDVDARFTSIQQLEIAKEYLPFLPKIAWQKADQSFEDLKGQDGQWTIPCEKSCRLRYAFDFGSAAKQLDASVLKVFDKTFLHNASIWIIRPVHYSGNPDVRLRFKVDGNARYATGLYPEKGKADSYMSKAKMLPDMPWTIFGPFEEKIFELPGAKVELALIPADYKLPSKSIHAWAKRAIDALVAFYGKFPVSHALIVVMPRNKYSGPGTSYGDGGAVTLNPLPIDATEDDLKNDWVMTHEMVHLAFPMVYRRHHWIEEGLATYIEPLARIRTGELNPEVVYRDMILGLPKGLPKEGDRGLDNTPTWGRTYWGGALFCFLADIELREKSKGKIGLEHALRAIVNAGGSLSEPWDLQKALKIADAGTGFTVLQDLYAKMKDAPHPVDLDAIWKKLGVELHVGGKVTLDNRAPLAYIRKGLESG